LLASKKPPQIALYC